MAATETKSALVITLSDDRLSATLSVRERVRKNSIKRADVVAALEEESIIIDDQADERIKAFIAEINKTGNCESPHLIAEGVPTQNAQHEALVWTQQFQDQAEEWKDDAEVNPYPTNVVVTIQKGEVIGTISPAVKATTGTDITGEETTGKGTPNSITLDQTLERNAETNEVTASVSGIVVMQGDALTVEPRKRIDDSINLETGNIKIGGHIFIEDRINDGMACTAKGSITVGGAIEAARVHASGDVFVRKGIIGRKTGLIQTEKSVTAKFMSEANIVCSCNMTVSAQLMNSYVCVDGCVIATYASIIGGATFSRIGVRAATIGNSANIPTKIVAGVIACDIRQIAEIDRKAIKIREIIKRIRQAIDAVSANGNQTSIQQTNMARELEIKVQSSQELLQSDKKLRAELVENINITEPSFVEVSERIFPKVTIRIGDRATSINEEMKGPVRIEKKKIKNVTELVATYLKTDRTKVLRSERCKPEDLLEGFKLEQDTDNLE